MARFLFGLFTWARQAFSFDKMKNGRHWTRQRGRPLCDVGRVGARLSTNGPFTDCVCVSRSSRIHSADASLLWVNILFRFSPHYIHNRRQRVKPKHISTTISLKGKKKKSTPNDTQGANKTCLPHLRADARSVWEVGSVSGSKSEGRAGRGAGGKMALLTLHEWRAVDELHSVGARATRALSVGCKHRVLTGPCVSHFCPDAIWQNPNVVCT